MKTLLPMLGRPVSRKRSVLGGTMAFFLALTIPFLILMSSWSLRSMCTKTEAGSSVEPSRAHSGRWRNPCRTVFSGTSTWKLFQVFIKIRTSHESGLRFTCSRISQQSGGIVNLSNKKLFLEGLIVLPTKTSQDYYILGKDKDTSIFIKLLERLKRWFIGWLGKRVLHNKHIPHLLYFILLSEICRFTCKQNSQY